MHEGAMIKEYYVINSQKLLLIFTGQYRLNDDNELIYMIPEHSKKEFDEYVFR